jgi:predicted DCC family thiol-disulfide oxidoreductase YuxK
MSTFQTPSTKKCELILAFDANCYLCQRYRHWTSLWPAHRSWCADSAQQPLDSRLLAIPELERLTRIQAVDEKKGTLSGFEAIEAHLLCLRGSMVLRPFLSLLRFTGWGERIYLSIASSRLCRVPPKS